MKLSPKAEIGAGVATVAALPIFADPVGLAMIAHGASRLHHQHNAVSSIPMYGARGYSNYQGYYRPNPSPWAIVGFTLLTVGVVGGVVFFAAKAAKASPGTTPQGAAGESKLPKLVPTKPPRQEEVASVTHQIEFKGDPNQPGDITMAVFGTGLIDNESWIEVAPGDVVSFAIPDKLVTVHNNIGYDIYPVEHQCAWVDPPRMDTLPGVTRYKYWISKDAPRPGAQCNLQFEFESVVTGATYFRTVKLTTV